MRQSVWILAVLICVSASFAFPPPDEYMNGRAVIYFTEDYNISNLDISRGIVDFKQSDLNNLSHEFNIYKIEKVFITEQKPDNPLLEDLSRWYEIYFPEELSVEQVVSAFKYKPYIEIVDVHPVVHMDFVPNDPMVASQYHVALTQLYEAWNITRGNYLVEVGITDSGYDTTHNDLRENLYINYGEDANGDSIIDLWDWNGIDDDNNGYTDDFHGWDFADYDNIPHDADPAEPGHGTHTAGLASADTDNELGVAGAGFNVRIMHIRIGTSAGFAFGHLGINYAANMGAEVISCSWGSTSPSPIIQSAINNAHNLGSVVCASAGNEAYPNAYNHYPSKFNHVIAVGATDGNDVKVSWSNFCITPFDGNCDVMAPGWQVLSTYMNNGYANLSGTSMSTPITAGICALIRSISPELTPAEVETVLVHGCDDIYPMNPGYQYGLLGYGRVNALNSLLLVAPYLSVENFTLTDIGNGDGRADPGESCELEFDLSNDAEAQTANNIVGTLTCDDEAVTITTGEISFGTIFPGWSVSNSGNPFVFEVGATDPHFAEFILTLSGDAYTGEFPIEIELGRPGILVVDDDGGDFFQEYYETSFELLDLFVDVWDQNTQDINADELNRYDVVVWETGNTVETLSQNEQTALQNFLDNGGNLLLSSKNAGADIGGTAFYSDYLHASFVQDTVITPTFKLNGESGHPYADGTSLFLIGGSGAGNTQSMDAIEPIGGAVTAYVYDSANDLIGGISYDGSYKLAYFSFPIESVTGLAQTTPRDVLIQNVLDWYGFVNTQGRVVKTIPVDFILKQNYPNPFNPRTLIEFALPQDGYATLQVFNSAGQSVAVLADGMMNAGYHSAVFDGENLSSGLYFARLKSRGIVLTAKMLLVK